MLNKIYWIAFKTVLRKEVSRFLRIWSQTLLPPAITMTLYFIIFGHVLGGMIGNIEGFRYIQYIAPGLIMMSVITNSYTNVVSSLYSIRFTKSIEELVVAPVPNALILLSFTAGGVARGIITGLTVTVIALFFTQLHLHYFLITLLVVILAATLFALAGFTNALFARSFDDISIIPTFVLTPLTYLGGIFYPLSLLPAFFQKLSLLNPILYMVNAFRYGILGISDISISVALVILLAASILLFVINLRLLNKGVGIRT